MLYRITASATASDDRILNEYPCLKDFGWKLVEFVENRHTRILDENMRSIYQTIPTTYYRPYIEINSLEELQKLQAAIEYPLIIYEDEIEIYDGYRE